MDIENETMQDHISRIETAVTGLRDFPQLQALLFLSAREAGRAEALGLLAGQPALRVRVESLAQGAADLAELAGAGLGVDSLSDGAAGLHKLATSLVQELRGLLAVAVQERTAAIALAAEEIPEAGPIDLTAEMKTMAAMPAPVRSDRPGIVVDAGPWDEHAYGRVSGDFLMGDIKPHGVDGVAPEESISIPAGMMVRMDAGERFRIHARGQRAGDSRDGAPLEHAGENIIVPLEGGVDVHGPAVITVLQKVDLTHVINLQEDMVKWLNIHEEDKKAQAWLEISCSLAAIMGFMGITTFMIGSLEEQMTRGLNAAMAFFLFGAIVAVSGHAITRRKKRKLSRKMEPGFLERIVRGVSCVYSSTFPESWTPQGAGTTIPDNIRRELKSIRRVTGGVNFRPYLKMWTVDGKARILKPLPALPAPGNVTPLDLGAARRKVIA